MSIVAKASDDDHIQMHFPAGGFLFLFSSTAH